VLIPLELGIGPATGTPPRCFGCERSDGLMTFSSRPAKPIVEEIINSIEADDDEKAAPAYRRDAAEADAPVIRDAWPASTPAAVPRPSWLSPARLPPPAADHEIDLPAAAFSAWTVKDLRANRGEAHGRLTTEARQNGRETEVWDRSTDTRVF
jgi:hypothetical protein